MDRLTDEQFESIMAARTPVSAVEDAATDAAAPESQVQPDSQIAPESPPTTAPDAGTPAVPPVEPVVDWKAKAEAAEAAAEEAQQRVAATQAYLARVATEVQQAKFRQQIGDSSDLDADDIPGAVEALVNEATAPFRQQAEALQAAQDRHTSHIRMAEQFGLTEADVTEMDGSFTGTTVGPALAWAKQQVKVRQQEAELAKATSSVAQTEAIRAAAQERIASGVDTVGGANAMAPAPVDLTDKDAFRVPGSDQYDYEEWQKSYQAQRAEGAFRRPAISSP